MGKTEFYAGLDLGQAHDYTALAVAQLVRVGTGEREPIPGSHVVYPDGTEGREWRERTHLRYDLRHLERFPLGVDYPSLVAGVGAIMRREPLASGATTLAIDHTGVGRPVVDMFLRARLPCTIVPITIHGGDTAHREGLAWSVPKRDLIAAVQVLLQTARLRVAPSLPEAATLTRELADYRVKISASGHDSYDAREGQHDDLVLAVALACWASEKGRLPRMYAV
jgi:hypothetical protein